MNPVYIGGLGVHLPNEPVGNDAIEDVLGFINARSSKIKSRILEHNGIDTRYYAIDPKTGRRTHSNVEITVEAIHAALKDASIPLEQIESLACGSSSPDQFIPNHACMTHAALGCQPIEAMASTGVCCCGMTAMKYGFMNVATGVKNNTVVAASELASGWLRSQHFNPEMEYLREELQDEPSLAFSDEFLRWMLSDGAAAVVLLPEPSTSGLSLRVDWIDILSFAHEAETCMYWGAIKNEDGSLNFFRDAMIDSEEVYKKGYLNLSQDVRVLRRDVPTICKKAGMKILEGRDLTPEKVDWYLPHLSSEIFKEPLYNVLAESGFEIPWEKWFTNLKWKGNTGSASIFIMLEELVSSGRAKKGDRILCAVPESARFSFSGMHLTVV